MLLLPVSSFPTLTFYPHLCTSLFSRLYLLLVLVLYPLLTGVTSFSSAPCLLNSYFVPSFLPPSPGPPPHTPSPAYILIQILQLFSSSVFSTILLLLLLLFYSTCPSPSSSSSLPPPAVFINVQRCLFVLGFACVVWEWEFALSPSYPRPTQVIKLMQRLRGRTLIPGLIFTVPLVKAGWNLPH